MNDENLKSAPAELSEEIQSQKPLTDEELKAITFDTIKTTKSVSGVVIQYQHSENEKMKDKVVCLAPSVSIPEEVKPSNVRYWRQMNRQERNKFSKIGKPVYK